jgi:SAM-dependent methyltransferase
MADNARLKAMVRGHWQQEPCESRAGKSGDRRTWFEEIDRYRYEKSPFIPAFARFDESRGKRVLEVGLGSGSDFIRWARAGAILWGRDLTEAAVALARERLAMEGLTADVSCGDVEALEFPDNLFDLVWSYGVIHHTPDTPKAVAEIHRVLKPGGTVRVMIYNLNGLTAFYEWCLFALLRGRPWLSRRQIMATYNESPGTKLYTAGEARSLFDKFGTVQIRTVIDSGDCLDFMLSERYCKRSAIRFAFAVAPLLRPLIRALPSRFGTTMLIEARK